MSTTPLDLTLLERVRHSGAKILARCPACAETGGDRSGNHLVILPSGKFACAATQGDAEHRRRIFALAGNPSALPDRPPPDSLTLRRQADERARLAGQEAIRQQIITRARDLREQITRRHPWSLAEVWEDSPQRIDHGLPERDPGFFLSALFPPGALLWTGQTHHSGQNGRHAAHWQTCRQWVQTCREGEPPGPMTTPAIWQPGTSSRTAAQVRDAPYTVLDFDGFDGLHPVTPEERAAHLSASLAIIRWIRECLCWRLAAILHTGHKSLHAWFHTPAAAVMESLKVPAAALGLDASLLGRPEHPCRLPGHPHPATRQLSRVLWLQLKADDEQGADRAKNRSGPMTGERPHPF